jgi:hypothetical protein
VPSFGLVDLYAEKDWTFEKLSENIYIYHPYFICFTSKYLDCIKKSGILF